MLFNSYVFVLLFLPLAFAGFHLCARYAGAYAARLWLLAVSLVFYAWYNPSLVALLAASVLLNFLCAQQLGVGKPWRRLFLAAGIVANLFLLGYFKYANFFLASSESHIVLPLAISFFTLQQIAFLVDVYEGLAQEHSLADYALFVAFFPKLVAGPIVHHSEMMPQLRDAAFTRFDDRRIAYGLFVFAVGLFKKVIIADNLTPVAAAGFDTSNALSASDAWFAAIGYVFQVYFDFSGYSDMAVGLGLLFNIRLPLNFNSPYQATSIIQFWQRWHMTLTGIINEYVYMPLMRLRSHFSFAYSLLVTVIAMAIVGFWHGANWNYLLFGVLNGLALVANHLWRRFRVSLPAAMGWLLTMLWWTFVVVIFRSSSMDAARRVYAAMVSGPLTPVSHAMRDAVTTNKGFTLVQVTVFLVLVMLALLASCVWFRNPHQRQDEFRTSAKYFLWTLVCLLVSVLWMNHVSEFIYFQF